MKPLAVAQDAENVVKVLLRQKLTEYAVTANVTNDVPSNWTPASKPHVTVYSDGSPRNAYPVANWPTIRIVARAADSTASKRLAAQCESLLCGHSGGAGVSAVRPLLGVQPTQDPDTNHAIAWFTVRAALRTTPF